MDFDQLETFLEVAKLSSFSRAAERRFRTQPAISAQIRALEEEVGAKLLDRSGGKVAITAPGKVFQKYAEETLEQRRVVLIALAEMHRVPRGEIVVAANEGTCLHILPEVFAEFKRQYPSVAVSVNRLEMLEGAMKLEAFQSVLSYDLALCYYQLGDRSRAFEYLGKARAGTVDPKEKQKLMQLLTFFTTGESLLPANTFRKRSHRPGQPAFGRPAGPPGS